jgi:hypothetical protein
MPINRSSRIYVLLPPMVCDALVAGCWRSGAGQPAMRSGWGMLLEQHNVNVREWSVVVWSVVKCSEVLRCSDVLLVLSFLSLCICLHVLCTFVSFCQLWILIVLFMYYCYVCSVVIVMYALLCIFCFHSGYPDWGLSVPFPQLQGKCQGITRKDRARSALFLVS